MLAQNTTNKVFAGEKRIVRIYKGDNLIFDQTVDSINWGNIYDGMICYSDGINNVDIDLSKVQLLRTQDSGLICTDNFEYSFVLTNGSHTVTNNKLTVTPLTSEVKITVIPEDPYYTNQTITIFIYNVDEDIELTANYLTINTGDATTISLVNTKTGDVIKNVTYTIEEISDNTISGELENKTTGESILTIKQKSNPNNEGFIKVKAVFNGGNGISFTKYITINNSNIIVNIA